MDDEAVVTTIQALTSRDFFKSMTSLANPRVWQDVYKPRVRGKVLYVKFTEDSMSNLLLISLKEA